VDSEDLIRFIRRLKRKLRKYEKLYSHNEGAVREQIVSPFLRMLKWNIEDPDQIIPEYPIGERKRKKLDYYLIIRRRGKAEHAVIEVKALGKAREGVSQAIDYARNVKASYVIVTDGDTWQLYDTSKPLLNALVEKWSILSESPREIAKKAQIIANTSDFGRKEALSSLEIQPRVRIRCPYCGHEDRLNRFSILKTWKYRSWNAYHLKCPACGRKFMFYIDPSGKRKSFTIPRTSSKSEKGEGK
jgi:predicted type IV restriction endonuclease